MESLSILRDSKFRKHLILALLIGLCLRLVFVIYFRASDDDTSLYQELGRNLMEHHVLGLTPGDTLVPSDIRMPGYPIFLGLLSVFFGGSLLPILIAQVLVDLGTCLLTALLAAALAPAKLRTRIAAIALWFAATCPFVANYTAVALTEVLATFFTTGALLILVRAYQGEAAPAGVMGPGRLWFLGGVVIGLGTLVRPETPLLAATVGMVLVARWYMPGNWKRLLQAGILLLAGVLTPLLPWAARNWISLHEVQFLSARYVQTPDEFVPLGFFAWTHTWLVSYDEVDRVLYKLGSGPMEIGEMPPAAFDSPEERARVAKLLEYQQVTFEISLEADRGFAELARERTARHPLRTYFRIPLTRAGAIWFRPRTELLPYSVGLWPPVRNWKESPTSYLVAAGFGLINILYVAMACAGAFFMRRKTGIAFLLAYVLARTLFFAWVHFTVEPRFVLVCFPSVLALAALFWAGNVKSESTPMRPA
jgi:4-amino-4-deoxy-L-arabinose transferase-like glycosyltransferase